MDKEINDKINNRINKRTVAFLDILGFKKMIEKKALYDCAGLQEMMFTTWSKLILHNFRKPYNTGDRRHYIDTLFPDAKHGEPLCKKFVFSDSIILISDDDSKSSILQLLICAWRLTQISNAYGVFLRGGISHGDMYVNEDRNIFLGEALTNAYILEQSQNWIGVSVDNTVVEALPWISERPEFEWQVNYFDALMPEYDVPLKLEAPIKPDVPLSGTTKRMRTLNWCHQFLFEDQLQSLFPLTGEEREDIKIRNTINYIDYIDKSKLRYCASNSTPYELIPFSLASGKTNLPLPVLLNDKTIKT